MCNQVTCDTSLGSKFVLNSIRVYYNRMSGSRSRSRSGPRRPDGDPIQMVAPIEMVVLTAQAEARLESTLDSLFSAIVELGPEPERQEAPRSSDEPICDPQISEWCRLLRNAEEIIRQVKADIYRVHNQVLVEDFGAPEGERTEWTQMVSDGALGIRWYQMVSRLMEEALSLESFSRSNLTQAARQSWFATSHWFVMAEALSILEEVMSLRGHMEGVIKDWLSSETMLSLDQFSLSELRWWTNRAKLVGLGWSTFHEWTQMVSRIFLTCTARSHGLSQITWSEQDHMVWARSHGLRWRQGHVFHWASAVDVRASLLLWWAIRRQLASMLQLSYGWAGSKYPWKTQMVSWTTFPSVNSDGELTEQTCWIGQLEVLRWSSVSHSPGNLRKSGGCNGAWHDMMLIQLPVMAGLLWHLWLTTCILQSR